LPPGNQMVADGGLTVTGGRLGGIASFGVSTYLDGVRLGAVPVPGRPARP
jgi:hypothetical protein